MVTGNNWGNSRLSSGNISPVIFAISDWREGGNRGVMLQPGPVALTVLPLLFSCTSKGRRRRRRRLAGHSKSQTSSSSIAKVDGRQTDTSSKDDDEGKPGVTTGDADVGREGEDGGWKKWLVVWWWDEAMATSPALRARHTRTGGLAGNGGNHRNVPTQLSLPLIPLALVSPHLPVPSLALPSSHTPRTSFIMGGGDLNMKKSWHPLLHTNQERVWKQEKKAYEERKKLDELKRERDQEREMQELQRLQEEAGGKKRVDKVDWMYATPAAGSGPSASELEDYLLGKKRVDQFLQQKAKESNQATTEKSKDAFIAIQNANTANDVAAKIREDPMFAIKQQEQAAYQALLKDPTRLRQMRAAAGLDVEDKEERRKRKEEKRRQKEEKRLRDDERRQGSSSRRDRHRDDDERGSRRDDYRERHPSERYYDEPNRRSDRDDYSRREYSRDDDRRYRDREYDSRPYYRDGDRHDRRRSPPHGPPPPSHRSRSRSPPPRQPREERAVRPAAPPSQSNEQSDREAKLARMQANAQSMNAQRSAYLDKVKAEEADELAAEEKARERMEKRKEAGKGSFLLDQQKKAFNGDLAERLQRAKGGLQRVGGD